MNNIQHARRMRRMRMNDLSAAQIADPPGGHWVDAWGRDAVMHDGLPRVIL